MYIHAVDECKMSLEEGVGGFRACKGLVCASRLEKWPFILIEASLCKDPIQPIEVDCMERQTPVMPVKGVN